MDGVGHVDRRLDAQAHMTAGARIVGTSVDTFWPSNGPVLVLIVGEAPGPRGADKSGIPFFGDAAGRILYDVLQRMGAMSLPPQLTTCAWDGAELRAAGLRPTGHGVALGNAYDRCPTTDTVTFRAPNRAELESDANLTRLTNDIVRLQSRGLRGIVTLGRVAARTLDVLFTRRSVTDLAHRTLPHPSAQGLLSMAPNRGKGERMIDLQERWMQRCQQAILDAGYPLVAVHVRPPLETLL